jgi:hypothetical protein
MRDRARALLATIQLEHWSHMKPCYFTNTKWAKKSWNFGYYAAQTKSPTLSSKSRRSVHSGGTIFNMTFFGANPQNQSWAVFQETQPLTTKSHFIGGMEDRWLGHWRGIPEIPRQLRQYTCIAMQVNRPIRMVEFAIGERWAALQQHCRRNVSKQFAVL